MSKRETTIRQNLIIKKLRKFSATFDEIDEYLKLEFKLQGYDFSISKRTFQRDIHDIRSIYNIDIQYNKWRGAYFIDSDEQSDANNRMIEAFDMLHAINISENTSDYLHFENRRPQGTENMYGLLHAIKSKLQIKFTYHKFWEDEPTHRVAEAYALKEFKNRWYVLANDLKDNIVKSFALDRLSELEITKNKFQQVTDFNVKEHYKNCFGIISPNNYMLEKVVLSFKPVQGKYIKALPLHKSQVIIVDTVEELRIELHVFNTFDFTMEILSYGEEVKVIEPQSLIEKIKSLYTNALNQYKL